MKLKLALFLISAILAASCGKQEEPQTNTEQNQQQMTRQQTQQQTQPQTQTQTTDATKKEEDKKKDEVKKKEDEKKKDEKKVEEKKKEVENTKGTVEESTKKTEQDIDFAPIFSKRCAKCHGKDLKGKEDGGPDLTRSETQSKSNEKLYNIISNGVKAETEEAEDMPAFKGKLTEDEINAAIKFIKSH